MSGSQGEYAHIDLTDGTEVIRILVDSFLEWTDISLDGLDIIVGRADSEVEPNSENDCHTLWNNRLTIISKERFYEIGADCRHGKFYGTLEEATAAERLKIQRYRARQQSSNAQDITEKAMEIAKRIIRREFKVKRICEADVTVSKSRPKPSSLPHKSRIRLAMCEKPSPCSIHALQHLVSRSGGDAHPHQRNCLTALQIKNTAERENIPLSHGYTGSGDGTLDHDVMRKILPIS